MAHKYPWNTHMICFQHVKEPENSSVLLVKVALDLYDSRLLCFATSAEI